MERIRGDPSVGSDVGYPVEPCGHNRHDRRGEVLDMEVLHRRISLGRHAAAGRMQHTSELPKIIV